MNDKKNSLFLLEKAHIVELKSFRSPPALVHLVLSAVAVLLGEEPEWSNIKKIICNLNLTFFFVNKFLF